MNSPIATIAPRDASSFAAHVAGRVPAPLRTSADNRSYDDFVAEFAPTTGPVRLGQWACAEADRPSTRWGPQAQTYRATLALGDRIATAQASACGPVAALTAMLHERGVAVEMTAFHQRAAGSDIATFIQGGNGTRVEWALGVAPDPVQSALRAVVACANRLLA
ncbi:homocitrate synthase [Mycobacterium sp. PSTR-4-N]|uniref:homocitrate synthase n=1 Tax=Mycobacterium sp. PSTR-4-N TaxID=2917745 RepID=UPI001F14F277|nr:homocitrate synthase [Mycobacterium sp. PSTR-4-N]MCG7593804.1 homocitrate synthase [Mycobacterium sp. PSTR-4-N]